LPTQLSVVQLRTDGIMNASVALVATTVDMEKVDSPDTKMAARMGRVVKSDGEGYDESGADQFANVIQPSGLGDSDVLSMREVEKLTSDENGAHRIQGIVFYDIELGWCRVTGWGVECEIVIAFYVSMDASDITLDEHFVPMDELISLIKMSPIRPVVPRFEASRQLKGIDGSKKMLCYRHRSNLSSYSSPSPVGSSIIRAMGAKTGEL
jgi:hypothetical protein